MNLRPYQREAVESVLTDLLDLQRVLIVLATGGGKCLGKGTPVMLFDGTIKPVEEIAAGDKLMGPDSTPRRVISTCRGIDPLYRVTPSKGDSYVVNQAHVLSLAMSGDRFPVDTIRDISVADYLKESKTFRHCAKGWRPANGVDFQNSSRLLIEPYMLGLWLGDGSSDSFAISKPDPEVKEAVVAFAKARGLRVRTDGTSCPTHHVVGERGQGNTALDDLRLLGVLGNKHVPHEYKTASREDRLALLAGMIDADGCLHHGGYDWISKDRVLADDLCFVARSLGFAAYMSPSRKRCQGGFVGDYFRVSINGDLSVLPVRIPRRKASPRIQKKRVNVVGIKVEPIGQGEYFGFEIDGDRRFLLGDFTVTHNTVIAGEMARRTLPFGSVLFLADAKELVEQAADKLSRVCGHPAAVVMGAASDAHPGDRLVVGTTQSFARRLHRWPANSFSLIIVDEAHRNSLGDQAQKVLAHFSAAQVVGMTATPFRSGPKQLGHYFQKISCDIGLARLIREGYLCRIKIRSVPCPVDLSAVRRSKIGGVKDLAAEDVAKAMEPHIGALAEMLAKNYEGRKTVGFVPLISTSKDLAAACRALGLRAVHVDGNDRTAMDCFAANRADIVLNSSLLTTGWDFPALSCVAMMRPSESFNLVSQMVGRGTRIFDGKDYVLVLDPLWRIGSDSLIRPTSLVTSAPIKKTETFDLLDASEEAEKEAEERKEADRLAKLKEAMEKNAKRSSREIDPVEFATEAGLPDLADYQPATDYEGQPATPKQIETLVRNGFPAEGWSLGRASKMIELLGERMRQGLASAKQVRFLRRQGVPNAFNMTFEEASQFISTRIAG